ncbi:MAG: cysteine-rich CWC family protein [Gammaproteobacteria bacterium]|nr:cysteine-rich CWC family protein [Gammaproteobacteria bacterium]
MAATCQEGPCWCRAETFPAALLARLPEEERDQQCICQSCLRVFEAEQARS